MVKQNKNTKKRWLLSLGLPSLGLLALTSSCSLVIPYNMTYKTYLALAQDVVAGLETKIVNNKMKALKAQESNAKLEQIEPDVLERLNHNALFLARQKIQIQIHKDIANYQKQQQEIVSSVQFHLKNKIQSYIHVDSDHLQIVQPDFFMNYLMNQQCDLEQFRYSVRSVYHIQNVIRDDDPNRLDISFKVLFVDQNIPSAYVTIDSFVGNKFIKYEVYQIMIKAAQNFLKTLQANNFQDITNYQDLGQFFAEIDYHLILDNQVTIYTADIYNKLYMQQRDLLFQYQKDHILRQRS
ncbi:hypothetical protein OF376_00535 [Ureaplasma miroungigenitalium]|uniref:Lipoprotein n=1 Tax=Ureaplasma miroungigenitalium TaxID=1042321 RepID=A0ABT3BM01_9BACT|nr:hypothetical protein [Ureaplasma miroungigenitalium]MCV3728275.1 hypothetical protein [Ureaplasma miroungigenitalium]